MLKLAITVITLVILICLLSVGNFGMLGIRNFGMLGIRFCRRNRRKLLAMKYTCLSSVGKLGNMFCICMLSLAKWHRGSSVGQNQIAVTSKWIWCCNFWGRTKIWVWRNYEGPFGRFCCYYLGKGGVTL